ncbi:hypothetical protein AB0G15_25155 [Streptosporangium sp. NPDC023825]|uniref:hypothetical protein n=1 Tax=Streptosporangium sp. NPDC023825 TaxID=3154909 RepID=UPI00343CFD7E
MALAAEYVPPTAEEIEQLFAGWREELLSCRKFAPAGRNHAVARLVTDVGLRINEARMLDLDEARWELGRLGKSCVFDSPTRGTVGALGGFLTRSIWSRSAGSSRGPAPDRPRSPGPPHRRPGIDGG